MGPWQASFHCSCEVIQLSSLTTATTCTIQYTTIDVSSLYSTTATLATISGVLINRVSTVLECGFFIMPQNYLYGHRPCSYASWRLYFSVPSTQIYQLCGVVLLDYSSVKPLVILYSIFGVYITECDFICQTLMVANAFNFGQTLGNVACILIATT